MDAKLDRVPDPPVSLTMPQMSETPRLESVLIVGGGILGLCTAHFLVEGGFEGEITVLDRDWSHERSSTATSVAAIRQQFRLEVNVRLSLFGNEFYSGAEGQFGAGIGYEPARYLLLAGPDGVDRMTEAHAAQRRAGADVEMLTPAQLSDRFPWLYVDDLGGGTLSNKGEGWIDPVKVIGAIRADLQDRGVILETGEARAFEISDGSVAGVRLEDGSLLTADALVNAAGPQAGHLMDRSGLELPIESRKRCAFVFEAAARPDSYPCLVDPTVANRSVFSRRYEGAFLAVTSPDPARDPDTDDLSVDAYLFENVIVPGLGHRVEAFDELRLLDSWAGHYEVNTFDQNGFIGLYPGLSNLFLNCGFSGHGVMHAPGAGRGLAELIVHGEYQSLDLTSLQPGRMHRDEPLDDLQPSESRDVQSGI